jgi:hypothetical protein
MLANTHHVTQVMLLDADSTQTLIDSIMGAAIFDLSGLPKEYFTTSSNKDVSWVQTIFQALGLQTLLMSSLQLEGFRYAVIHGADNQAIIVRQKNCYTAVLLAQSSQPGNQSNLIKQIQDLEPASLKAHPQFQSV